MINDKNENMSLQVEEPGAEQQGVGSANDNKSISSLNFDVSVCPDSPTSKTNGVTGLEWLEPTIAPEGGNIAGSEGAIYM